MENTDYVSIFDFPSLLQAHLNKLKGTPTIDSLSKEEDSTGIVLKDDIQESFQTVPKQSICETSTLSTDFSSEEIKSPSISSNSSFKENDEEFVLAVFEPSFIETTNKVFKYECPICHKKFKTTVTVQNHVNNHISVQGNFICSVCELPFGQSKSFELHVQSHHRRTIGRPPKKGYEDSVSELKCFICEFCGKYFKLKQQLIVHKVVHEGIREYECDDCHKMFKLEIHLKTHVKTHSKRKPFFCKMCKKHFRLKQHLDNHYRTHSDIRPFQCDICVKTFKFKQQLQYHELVHEGLRKFECHSCQKKFKFKQHLQMHVRIHRPD